MLKYYPIQLFHAAGISDNTENLSFIISKAPELINSTNKFNYNALHIATKENNIDNVKLLCSQTDIDFNLDSDDGNPFLIALKYNHIELLKYFIELDRFSLFTKNNNKKGVFHIASIHSQDFILEYLISKKIPITQLDLNNEHCLYDFVSFYYSNKNICFYIDLLNNFKSDFLFNSKNNKNFSIVDILEKKSNSSSFYKPLYNLIKQL